jgi:hypothetical protein
MMQAVGRRYVRLFNGSAHERSGTGRALQIDP